MAPAKRQDVIDAFQEVEDGDEELRCDIFVGPIALLGTGVNLTRATKPVILDVDYLEASVV